PQIHPLPRSPLIPYTTLFRSSHRADPVILRLNKETGDIIGLHDLEGGSGVDNEFRVITTDNDGNYIAGGHFFGALEHPVTGEPRSEEHTSELQSRENLVCRLL